MCRIGTNILSLDGTMGQFVFKFDLLDVSRFQVNDRRREFLINCRNLFVLHGDGWLFCFLESIVAANKKSENNPRMKMEFYT